MQNGDADEGRSRKVDILDLDDLKALDFQSVEDQIRSRLAFIDGKDGHFPSWDGLVPKEPNFIDLDKILAAHKFSSKDQQSIKARVNELNDRLRSAYNDACLFERVFASNGATVSVTQASRDQGVDAIINDPDPIKGGKIVIQAKRYVNTVDVSAVRDLWGTVSHEGAMKGLLVTTSQFGPDSYAFSKDKPLTLINGSELLYLLEQNGYKFRIDLEEARKLLKENGIQSFRRSKQK